MNNLTQEEIQAMMMQMKQKQQPTGLMPTSSNSAIIAKLLKDGGAATSTIDPIGRGMSNAAASLSAGFAGNEIRKDKEAAELQQKIMTKAMEDKIANTGVYV